MKDNPLQEPYLHVLFASLSPTCVAGEAPAPAVAPPGQAVALPLQAIDELQVLRQRMPSWPAGQREGDAHRVVAEPDEHLKRLDLGGDGPKTC